jgi:putative transposase
MGRQPRLIADGLVYHALNRGNNRAAVFHQPTDYLAFLQALGQTQQRYPFRLYAYCLMTNHFHLVLQPGDGQSISRILQSLTVAHTWRCHREHGSVGHVWQGRFRSPAIQEDEHLLTVLRYVEANPLRAGMVSDLAAYPWSSYPAHGLGRADPLLSEAPVWPGRGPTAEARQAYWREWVHTPLTERELAAVRKAVTTGRPYGSEGWVNTMALRLGIDLEPKPPGRPRKKATT